MRLILVIGLFIYVSLSLSHGQCAINNVPLKGKNINDKYCFLVGGHIYGQIGNSVFPSASLLSNMDTLVNLEVGFFVCLGDNFRQIDSIHVNNFKKSFLNKWTIPVFNAVGNHDLSPNQATQYHIQDYKTYNELFGNTFCSFDIKTERYIIVDTEKDKSNINNTQLVWLKGLIDTFSRNDALKNLFIFSHKRIWENDQSNFKSDILPLLKAIQTSKKVYWLSGDYIEKGKSLYYLQENNISYIAISLKDDIDDRILRVNIENDSVAIQPISLTGVSMLPFETFRLDKNPHAYTPSYWQQMILSIKNMISSKYFYAGTLLSFLILSAVYYFYLKR